MAQEIPEVLIEKNRKFIDEIHFIASINGNNYVDAIVSCCEKHNIEIESVSAIVAEDANLRSCLRRSAEDLNFLPKQARIKFD